MQAAVGGAPEIVSLTQMIRVKRLLAIAPNLIKILCALFLGLLVATIVFGMLLRIVVIIAFLVYAGDGQFVLVAIPVFFVTFGLFMLAAALPFWLLSQVSKDSVFALCTSTVISATLVYFFIEYRHQLDQEDVLFVDIALCVLGATMATFVIHMIYLVYVRHSTFGLSVTSSRTLLHLNYLPLFLPKSIGLFVKAIFVFQWRMARLAIVGSVIWLPIAVISVVASPVAMLIMLFLFIWKRRAVSTAFLSSFRELKAKLQRNATELLRIDSRAPILFLRSFHDDQLTTGNSAGKVLSVILGLDVDTLRLEECIVDMAGRLGPVIALSPPGSSISPMLGAAKERATGDWKELVQKYLDQSQLIVLIYGTSAGLKWEIEEIHRRGYAHKLVLVSALKPDVDSAQVIATFPGNSGAKVNLGPGERVLAIAGHKASGVAHAVTSSFEDAMSYTLAIRYCMNINNAARPV